MQKINLIAQGVLKLSHRENLHDDDEDDDDEDDTHPGWIIVRDGIYSVADKNFILIWQAQTRKEIQLTRFQVKSLATFILEWWVQS